MNKTRFKNWCKIRKLKTFLKDGDICAEYGEGGFVMYFPSHSCAICMGVKCHTLEALTSIYNATRDLPQHEAFAFVLAVLGK